MTPHLPSFGVGLFLLVAAFGSSAYADCKPGTSHCVTASSTIPKFCGSVTKPCTIDGGLGGTCKGDMCGTGPTGPEDNPYFPYSFGNERVSAPTSTPPSNPTFGVHAVTVAHASLRQAH